MGRQLGLGTLVQLRGDRLPRVLGPTPPRHFWVGTARQLEELRVLVRVDIDLHSVINSWKKPIFVLSALKIESISWNDCWLVRLCARL